MMAMKLAKMKTSQAVNKLMNHQRILYKMNRETSKMIIKQKVNSKMSKSISTIKFNRLKKDKLIFKKCNNLLGIQSISEMKIRRKMNKN